MTEALTTYELGDRYLAANDHAESMARTYGPTASSTRKAREDAEAARKAWEAAVAEKRAGR